VFGVLVLGFRIHGFRLRDTVLPVRLPIVPHTGPNTHPAHTCARDAASLYLASASEQHPPVVSFTLIPQSWTLNRKPKPLTPHHRSPNKEGSARCAEQGTCPNWSNRAEQVPRLVKSSRARARQTPTSHQGRHFKVKLGFDDPAVEQLRGKWSISTRNLFISQEFCTRTS
jgi:hypothetical protein